MRRATVTEIPKGKREGHEPQGRQAVDRQADDMGDFPGAHLAYAGMNLSATPLLHQRCLVGGGPSSNTCP
jgi:hypothetical protein